MSACLLLVLVSSASHIAFADSVITTVTPVPYAQGIAFDPNNGYIYVTNSCGEGCIYPGNVTVIDGSTNKVVTTLAVGGDPMGVAFDPADNEIYVANCDSENMAVISGSTNTVVKTIATLEDCPDGVAFDSVNNDVYVTDLGSGTVSVIDGSTDSTENTLVTNVLVGPTPWGVAVDTTYNYIYVTLNTFDAVTVISGATNKVVTPYGITSYYIDEPQGVAFDSSNGEIYVADYGDNRVSAISVTSVVATVGVEEPNAVAFDSANGDIYVASAGTYGVSVINGSSNTIVTTLKTTPWTGAGLYDLQGAAFDSANGDIYVTNAYVGSVPVISPSVTTTTTTTSKASTSSSSSTAESSTSTSSSSTTFSCGCSKQGKFVSPTVSNPGNLTTCASSCTSPDGSSEVKIVTVSSTKYLTLYNDSGYENLVIGNVINPLAWGWSSNSQFFVVAYHPTSLSPNQLDLQVWDLMTGHVPSELNPLQVTYGTGLVPPSGDNSSQSAATAGWGFSPNGLSFLVFYFTASNPSEFNLAVYNSVTGVSPAALNFDYQNNAKSLWQFSPCGDIFMYVYGIGTITGTASFYSAPNGVQIGTSLSLEGGVTPSATVESGGSGSGFTISLTGMSQSSLEVTCTSGQWSLHSNATILVTDSSGLSVGCTNHTTGATINQIQNATYTGCDSEPQIVTIPDPTGNYTVTLTPIGGGGPYELDYNLFDSQGPIASQTTTDSISSSIITYEYDAGTLVVSAAPISAVPQFPPLSTTLPLLMVAITLLAVVALRRFSLRTIPSGINPST